MRTYLLFAVLVVRGATAASEPPTTPSAGVIREPDQTLRPVYGFSANLINGQPLALRDVLASSFSDAAGLVLTSRSLKLVSRDGSELGAAYSTSETHPVLSITGEPKTAIAWLPGEQKFVWWTGSAFTSAPFDSSQLPGPLVALQSLVSGSVAEVWVAAQAADIQHLRISLATGLVSPLESAGGVGRLVFVDGATLIFEDAEGLEVRNAAGESRTIPMPPGDLIFEKASAHWIHIAAANQHRQWMLYLNGPDATLSALPAFQASAPEARQ